MSRFLLFLFLSIFPVSLFAATVKLPVTADAGVSSERGHFNDNSGASVTVPVRQNQNWSGFETKAYLIRFDTGKIRGWSVSRAWLNIFLARGDLHAVGLCTVLADWDEGTGLNGQTGRGGASWNWAREPARDKEPARENFWSWPGSGIYSVSWAHPDARYSYAGPGLIEKKELDRGRILHLRFPVDPELVESLAAGLAGGLVLTDDKGQVAEAYSLKGTGRPYRYDRSQDIYLYTKDIQDPDLRPYLEVEGEAADRTAPGAVGPIQAVETDPCDPSVTVAFTAPAEDGGGGGPALGYEVRVSSGQIEESSWDSLERIPLWAVPAPEEPGATQRMRVFTLAPGTYHLGIRATDEAGNLGPVSQTELRIPEIPSAELTAVPGRKTGGNPGKVVFDNLLEIWACPDLCKVDPLTGSILLDAQNYQPAGDYRFENQVWSSATRTVSLEAARGEVVAFQLVLGRVNQSSLSGVKVTASDLSGPGGRIRARDNLSFFRVWYLDVVPRQEELTGPWELIADKGHKPAWHGDACLPLEEPFQSDFSLPTGDNMGGDQRWQSVWIDLYVPSKAKSGDYQGRITITANELNSPAAIELKLEVLPIRLPDQVTWPVELNGYHTGIAGFSKIRRDSEKERYDRIELHFNQMAHAHRTTLNVLPYSQAGEVPEGNAPVLEGSGKNTRIKSWNEWESRYGKYLDGKAFTSRMGYRGPGAGVPVSQIYLPIHENWPMQIKEHYADYREVVTREEFADWAKTSRPPDEAFDEDYKQGFISVVSQMFRHFKDKGYFGTKFQVYLNNKYYYKTDFFGMRGGGEGSSFWLLDEPVDYDDYEANRFFLDLTRKGYERAGVPGVGIEYRTDVSQPEMSRGLWDGLCNLWNSSGLLDFATTAAFRMRRLPGENYWRYGGETRISGRLLNYQENFFTVWSIGAAGAMGCWNVFSGGDWFRPDNLSIIYRGREYARTGRTFDGVFPGVRLKAMRRAQQDVEYLNLLAAKKGWSRNRVRRALAAWADDPDAPSPRFTKLTAERLFELRRALARAISE